MNGLPKCPRCARRAASAASCSATSSMAARGAATARGLVVAAAANGCVAGQDRGSTGGAAGLGRRAALALLAGLGSTFAHARQARAFDFVEASPSEQGIVVNANDFELVVPSDFEDVGVPAPRASAAPGGPPQASPVRVIYKSKDRAQTVYVLVKESSAFKPTFLQAASGSVIDVRKLQDITQWGGPDEVARLVLPPGTRAQQLESRILKSAPKDTGTVRGTVEVAPTTIYRYRFVTGRQTPAVLAVGAKKGRVYMMVAEGPRDAAHPHFELALATFACKEEFRPRF